MRVTYYAHAFFERKVNGIVVQVVNMQVFLVHGGFGATPGIM